MEMAPLLQATAMTKRFGDFTANDKIDFAINPGEIHALLGENGAGKSTFVKMIYGVLQPDEGHFAFQGQPVAISNPQAARQMGIGMVFQHFSQFEALTVAENIQLAMDGDEAIDQLSERIETLSAAYGIPIGADRIVADLSVGEQQRVEILRCLLQSPKLLIMDEPTSVLTPQETEQLFKVIRQLADEGCAILFISHKLDEIKALCPRATILRGGKKIDVIESAKQTTRQIAELMVGTSISDVTASSHQISSDVLFDVKHLSKPAEGPFDVALDDVSFTLRPGQILGVAGIAGNGQDELLSALIGEWRHPASCTAMALGGQDMRHLAPEKRRQAGMGFIPEDRNGHAAVPGMNLTENTLLTSHSHETVTQRGFVNRATLQQRAAAIISEFDVRTPHDNPNASQLSGGNLQKFVVGREILKQPDVLIVSQPSWGVDIGAAMLIRQALLDLASSGSAILLISQDLEELFSLSSHIAVLYAGTLSASYDVADMTPEKIGLLMGGATIGEAS